MITACIGCAAGHPMKSTYWPLGWPDTTASGAILRVEKCLHMYTPLFRTSTPGYRSLMNANPVTNAHKHWMPTKSKFHTLQTKQESTLAPPVGCRDLTPDHQRTCERRYNTAAQDSCS